MFYNTIVREFISRLLDSVDEGAINHRDAYEIISAALSYLSKVECK